MPKTVEIRAIEYCIQYLKKLGFKVLDVSRTRGHNGYDLIGTQRKKKIKIEVKGCTRTWGIPDPYMTEFDEKKRLVADFMYIVYFLGKSRPKLCLIPRKAFKPDLVVPKSGYRISGRFKNEKSLKQYLIT